MQFIFQNATAWASHAKSCTPGHLSRHDHSCRTHGRSANKRTDHSSEDWRDRYQENAFNFRVAFWKLEVARRAHSRRCAPLILLFREALGSDSTKRSFLVTLTHPVTAHTKQAVSDVIGVTLDQVGTVLVFSTQRSLAVHSARLVSRVHLPRGCSQSAERARRQLGW